MADKKKSGIGLMPTFVDGEQPTAHKFNSIGAQTKRANFIIEKAVGDIWDESWPYSNAQLETLSMDFISDVNLNGYLDSASYGRKLDIASIARLIGPASNLNPLTLSHSNFNALEKQIIEEVVPIGVFSFMLEYLPYGSVTFSDTLIFANQKFNGASVVADGDYFISSSGEVFTYTRTRDALYAGEASPSTVTYKVRPINSKGMASYVGASFNTIPDPAQLNNTNANSLVITAQSDGKYLVELPLITDQQFSLKSNTTNLQSSTDINTGVQLELPMALTFVCGGSFRRPSGASAEGIPGALIPDGFVYLKNHTTGKIYSESTYYYQDRRSLKISLEEEIDLVNHKFYLITVGTNITSSILNLNRKMALHSHDRTSGEQPVRANSLSHVLGEGIRGAYYPSDYRTNHFPQYLHRDGYMPYDVSNDKNAMRGDFVIGRKQDEDGNTITSAGNFLGEGSTFKIAFGEGVGTVPAIRQSVANLFGNLYSSLIIENEKPLGSVSLSAALSVNTSSEKCTIESTKGVSIKGGVSSSHEGTSSLIEANASTFPVARNEWFHPKTYKIALNVNSHAFRVYSTRSKYWDEMGNLTSYYEGTQWEDDNGIFTGANYMGTVFDVGGTVPTLGSTFGVINEQDGYEVQSISILWRKTKDGATSGISYNNLIYLIAAEKGYAGNVTVGLQTGPQANEAPPYYLKNYAEDIHHDEWRPWVAHLDRYNVNVDALSDNDNYFPSFMYEGSTGRLFIFAPLDGSTGPGLGTGVFNPEDLTSVTHTDPNGVSRSKLAAVIDLRIVVEYRKV